MILLALLFAMVVVLHIVDASNPVEYYAYRVQELMTALAFVILCELKYCNDK